MSDDDRSLAIALADDLDGRFETLVRTFQDRLYAFALRLTGSPQEAEESIQDTFVRAYRALETYPVERKRALLLRPWLYQIALNVVRNRVRRSRPPTVDLDDPRVIGMAESGDERPEHRALASERQRELVLAIARLPRRYAEAVVLRHVQGLSYGESAMILGRPVGTVKSDVHRALRLLRDALAPELLLEAAGSL